MLDVALTLDDLKVPPGNRLEKLHGNRRGQYSIRINDQYRICFEWRGPDAYDVENKTTTIGKTIGIALSKRHTHLESSPPAGNPAQEFPVKPMGYPATN